MLDPLLLKNNLLDIFNSCPIEKSKFFRNYKMFSEVGPAHLGR